MLGQHDSHEAGEHAGPLDEIEFWRARSVDLSGIRNQLDSPQVHQIAAILEYSKSSYLPPFLELRDKIQREATVAEDNLAFLLCLTEPCNVLRQAVPRDIPGILPGILNRVRVIWNVSRFYNTPDRVLGLLRKISNEINERCASVIDLGEVFVGDL